MSKTSKSDARCAPAFHLLRQFLVHALAKEGVPTVEIAKRLGHVRSFVIKQTTITLKPRTPLERRILKLIEPHQNMLKRAGLGGLTAGADIETVLAGGERPKLGTLESRRAKSAKSAKKAPTKTKSTKKAPAKAAPAAKPKAPKAPEPAKVETKASKPARARKPRPKAGDLKAPLPAPKLLAEATENTKAPDASDALLDGILGTPSAEMPV